MKAVLMSIRPKWIRLIEQGRKTVEIRKTEPSFRILYPPFKVYVYCTAGKDSLVHIIRDGEDIYGEIYHGKKIFIKVPELGTQRRHQAVIGEFTCDAIEDLCGIFEGFPPYHLPDVGDACMSLAELEKYANGGKVYGWHISSPIWYRDAKPLSAFGLSRPPQSWQYIEVKMEETQ